MSNLMVQSWSVVARCRPIVILSARSFHPKSYPMVDKEYSGELPRKFGYEAHHHTKGLLPRLKIKEKRIPTMPITAKEDPWTARQAMMGQNDFIKIFSDQDIQQHELLTHIPDWLRGYRNTDREYSVLMRKRKEFEYWQYAKPQKWMHLEQRIKFLYRRINNKYRPPDAEGLHKSRHLL